MLFGLVLLYLIHALGLSQTVYMMSERCKRYKLQVWRAQDVIWQSIQCLYMVQSLLSCMRAYTADLESCIAFILYATGQAP